MKTSVKLSEIQRHLANAIKNGVTEALPHFIKETPPISVSQRIGIYQDAYHIRMIESLGDDFPRLKESLGEGAFKELATVYLRKYPSRFASLAEFSLGFPEYFAPISANLYRLASLDKIDLLSSYGKRLPEKIANPNEIQAGVPFRLIRNPTLHVFSDASGVFISFSVSDRTVNKELTVDKMKILSLFNRPFDVRELSAVLSQVQTDTELNLALISEWIKEEIILCEKLNF